MSHHNTYRGMEYIEITCECCGKSEKGWANKWVWGAKTYCNNCNRPFGNQPGLEPCDHKPWRVRWHKLCREDIKREKAAEKVK